VDADGHRTQQNLTLSAAQRTRCEKSTEHVPESTWDNFEEAFDCDEIPNGRPLAASVAQNRLRPPKNQPGYGSWV